MKKIVYTISIIVFLISSCNEGFEEIEWDLDEQPARLVVEGEITSFYEYQKISLKESDTYFSNKAAKRISNASVVVSDGQNQYVFIEDPVQKGVYISEIEFGGIVGKTYTLNVELETAINGETSYSSSSKMNEGIYIEYSTSFIYKNPLQDVGEGDSTVLLTYVFGSESPEVGNYYAINLYRNSELINDTIDEKMVLYDDESGINGEDMMTFFFMELFQETDTVTIEIKSVDKGYYEFIDGVQKVAQGYDPFGFSGPPANPVGNIEGGGAFGYFLATYKSRHSSFPEYVKE